MTCADWRAASAEALDRLYEVERAVWEQQLEWDTRDSWREVEAARRAGRLPGVVLTGDAGQVRGFGYCLVDGVQALLGPLVTDRPDAAPALAGAVLDVARRAGASRASYFGLDTGPALAQALAAAGFESRAYVYLTRALTDLPSSDDDLSPWTPEDQTPAARLLQAAYGSEGRFFAADGRLDEWHRYVGNLVAFGGCGRFEARATRVARAGDGLTGLALVTTIRPGVAHLAQLAVHPDARGSGLGARLLDQAMAQAAAAGCRTMTLLVEAASPAATRLYASRGFSHRAGFLAAWLARLTPGVQ